MGDLPPPPEGHGSPLPPPSGVLPAPPIPAQQPATNGMAVASLVLGILWLCGIGSVLALVFGYMGRDQIRKTGGIQGGSGLAIAGIVLGWVGIGTVLLFLLITPAGSSN